MRDRDFLEWLHERLRQKHGESVFADYMGKLRSIIVATPADAETPNTAPDLPSRTVSVSLKPNKGSRAMTEAFLLSWLAREESSAYGECCGSTLDALVAKDLVVVGPVPPGTAKAYARVTLTEAGRAQARAAT